MPVSSFSSLISVLNSTVKNYACFVSVNTHMHADHITGTGVLKGLIPGSKSVISKASNAQADVLVSHGDIVEFGDHKIEVRSTPGHTNGSYFCSYFK